MKSTTNFFTKMLTQVATSSAKSLMGQGIKSSVKKIIKQHMAKTPQQIEQEITNSLGYLTAHYKLDKEQNIIYKPSVVFMHEWLTNSPSMKDKLVKDEEDGQVYFNGQPLTNQDKVNIIHQFLKATNSNSSALASHFEGAMKLFEVSDFNSIKFKNHFAGWQSSNTSVIDTWLERSFGTALTTDKDYARMLFRKWMIGSAKRIMTPGSSLDGCLVLAGPTDIGKTQFFRRILPEPFNNRTGEIYCDIKNPTRFVETLLGKSVACFDELSILEHEKTIETLKQLLTSQWLDVRLAWRRSVQRFKIRVGLGATTNKTQFLTDPTLSRRMWVIELNDTQRLDFEFFDANKKALWQEAVFLANRGDICILTPEETDQVETYNRKFLITQ